MWGLQHFCCNPFLNKKQNFYISTLDGSISISKYPLEEGANLFLATFEFSSNTGVNSILDTLPSVISLLFTKILFVNMVNCFIKCVLG